MEITPQQLEKLVKSLPVEEQHMSDFSDWNWDHPTESEITNLIITKQTLQDRLTDLNTGITTGNDFLKEGYSEDDEGELIDENCFYLYDICEGSPVSIGASLADIIRFVEANEDQNFNSTADECWRTVVIKPTLSQMKEMAKATDLELKVVIQLIDDVWKEDK